MTLLQRLLVVFLPLAILPPLAIGVLQWQASREVHAHDRDLLEQARSTRAELQEQVRSMQEGYDARMRASELTLVTEIAAGIDGRLSSLESVASLVVRSPLTRAFLDVPAAERTRFQPALQDLLDLLCEETGTLEISLLHLDGRELVRATGLFVPAGGDAVLDAVAVENVRRNESLSPWLQTFLQSPRAGTVSVVSRYDDISERPWVVDIAIPVRTRSNRVARTNRDADAVLRTTVLLDQLTRAAFRLAGDKDIELSIEPREPGIDVAREEYDRISASCIAGQVDVLLAQDSRARDHERIHATEIARVAQESIEHIEARTTEAMTSVRRHELALQILLIATSLVTIAVVVRTARNVSMPMARLAAMTRRLARGKLDRTITLEGTVEMRQLGEDFDRMRRELQLQMKELAHANHELTHAMEIKSQFLANMSHEIRTPLNGVLGMTELLLDTGLDEQQRQFAETVHGSGETLLRVINDILDLSKIEAGKLEIEQIAFPLRSTIEATADLLALSAHRKGLELVCVLAPGLPESIVGDPTRLRQVLGNLCTNAIKFTESGQVVLRVTEPASQMLRFEVADTGIGIDEVERERLFRPFSQVDASTTRRYGGTGLGLAICRQLVERMGGTIDVHSKKGVGSTFWFEMPYAVSEAARPAEAPLDASQLRVLICEDNATVRQQLSFELLPLGVHVDITRNCAEAAAYLGHARETGNRYDLVLADWPILDHEGASEDWWPCIADQSTSLVALVPLGTPWSRDHAQRAGVNAVLTKPVKRADLIARLREVLEHDVEPTVVIEDPSLLVVASAPHSNREPARVLVAEDNDVNQRLIVRMLEKLGHEAEVVVNGEEALRMLRREDFDLVLMDLQMPVMGGIEAAQLIRDPDSGVRDASIPIVAVTANAMEGDREHCLTAGMSDYLSKPIRAGELAATLHRVLDAHRASPGRHPGIEEPLHS